MSVANEIQILREEVKRALGACDALATLAPGIPAAPSRVAAMRELGKARTDLVSVERRLGEMAAEYTPVRPHSPAEVRAAHKSAEHFAEVRRLLKPVREGP